MRKGRFIFGWIFSHVLATGGWAYTWEQDSIAVRLTLNENGLYAVPVSQVATRIQDRIQKLKFDGLPVYSIGYELFTLDSLKSFSMVKCGLRSLPPTISQWPSLEELNLSDNLLTQLPLDIGSLNQLNLLNLRGNALRTLPDTICNLRKLIFLDIGKNLISTLPAKINRLDNLSYLYADQDSLVSIPETIALLPFLKELNVSGNRLASLPYSIAAMSSLEVLDVSINDLTSLPDEWALLTTLTTLDISSNHLCGLSLPLAQWAESKQPGWLLTQFCGPDGQSLSVREHRKDQGMIRQCPDGLWFAASWAHSAQSISVVNVMGRTESAARISRRAFQGQPGWFVETPRAGTSGRYLKVVTRNGDRIIPWSP